jgi:hypothetical protein
VFLCSLVVEISFQISLYKPTFLTFIGPCIVRIFQYISNKMQRYTVYFICLHVSGDNTTHHQECKQPYLQHLVYVTPLLLPTDIVEGLKRSSNSSKSYTVYFICLHVSGDNTTHHQERKQLYLQHLVYVTPLLLPTDIVEGLKRSSNSSKSYTVYFICLHVSGGNSVPAHVH